MSRYLARSATWACMWGAGDLLAQMYSAHADRLERRARGERRQGSRPTFQAMFSMVDQARLGESVLFGALMGPCIVAYERGLYRIFGSQMRSVVSCLCGLGLQQLFVTPLMLLAYFNAMTLIRGGLTNPRCLASQTLDSETDFFSVQRYIVNEVMPFPLLASWAVYTPRYIMFHYTPFRGFGFLCGCLFIPWAGLVSYQQVTELM